MKKNIIDWGLLLLMTIFSVSSWWSVDRVIFGGGAVSWSLSILLTSFLIISFLLFSVIVKNRIIIFLGLACVFCSSLFFVPYLRHFLLVIVSFFVALLADLMIKSEIGVVIPMDIWRIVRPSRWFLIFAITLTIASQYNYSVLNVGLNGVIPEVRLGKTESRLAANLISLFDRDFSASKLEDMTVDEFIMIQAKKNEEEVGNLINIEVVGELPKEAYLSEGRSRISEISGIDISGNEKAFDVFTEIVNYKVRQFFSTNIGPEILVFIPWTIFVLLFFMIFSIASFLMPLLVMITKIIFGILVKIKVINLGYVQVKKEVIL